MKKVLAKNPGDGDEIDDARADRSGDEPVQHYPRYTSDQPPRGNPMNDTMENAISVAGIAAGQAAADELVELLAEQLGEERGVIVHLLIESGILIALGSGTLYVTDQQIARSLAVGVIAQGTVNGARILIREARDWMESDDDSSVDGLQGLRGLPAGQRRAVAQLMAAQNAPRQQLAPGAQRRERERRERGPGRRTSGKLASNGRVQMVRQS